jgi:hypothetical protein
MLVCECLNLLSFLKRTSQNQTRSRSQACPFYPTDKSINQSICTLNLKTATICGGLQRKTKNPRICMRIWHTLQPSRGVKGSVLDAKRDLSYVKRDLSYIKRDLSYIKRDLSYIKRDLSYIKRDLSYIKRDPLTLTNLATALDFSFKHFARGSEHVCEHRHQHIDQHVNYQKPKPKIENGRCSVVALARINGCP